jgi:fluoride exporter
MGKLLLIGAGGFMGAILRYLLSDFINTMNSRADFPLGTLVVNLSGCFMIGFLSVLAETRGLMTAETRLFLFIGILGAFTTFSTFGLETMSLLAKGQNLAFFSNIGLHIGLGLTAVWIGGSLARMLLPQAARLLQNN